MVEETLAHADPRAHVDLSQPVAILLFAMLHFVADDEDPAGIVARLRDAMAPGSYLALSHATDLVGEKAEGLTRLYTQASSGAVFRTHDQILRLFDGFELIDPGLVALQDWRPDTPPGPESRAGSWFYAGVGRKH
ncbi:MAG: SAM-dependent methyltransferase [Streptosporangiaceae bacterium]